MDAITGIYHPVIIRFKARRGQASGIAISACFCGQDGTCVGIDIINCSFCLSDE
ncbi:hypothetical protein D3C76_1755840 [compost metagenome]